jgi:uncharacterized protein (DUF2141 family)
VVNETRQYSAAEMEQMMEVQDVLLKAVAKKITWWAAAEIIGVTDRTMRRCDIGERSGSAAVNVFRRSRPFSGRRFGEFA